MIRVQPDDAPTAPLPELSQFFTWSPTDDPTPYPPPATDIPPLRRERHRLPNALRCPRQAPPHALNR